MFEISKDKKQKKVWGGGIGGRRKAKAFSFSKHRCLQQDIRFFQDTNDEQLGHFFCPSGAYILLIKKEIVL